MTNKNINLSDDEYEYDNDILISIVTSEKKFNWYQELPYADKIYCDKCMTLFSINYYRYQNNKFLLFECNKCILNFVLHHPSKQAPPRILKRRPPREITRPSDEIRLPDDLHKRAMISVIGQFYTQYDQEELHNIIDAWLYEDYYVDNMTNQPHLTTSHIKIYIKALGIYNPKWPEAQTRLQDILKLVEK